jgi:N-acetylglucosamine-6-phosphate deacetylase
MNIRAKLPSNHEFVDLVIRAGHVASIQAVGETGELSDQFELGGTDFYLAPGLLDLQINGFAGVDFNDASTTPEQIATAFRQLWRTGTTGLLPTVITGAQAHISQCFANLLRAADEFPEVERGLLGFHLEGPFISPEDGPRGAHPQEHVRPPDWEEFQRWQDAARGQIRLVTLAPEWPAATSFIERATAAGLIVALGHTAATPQQIRDAIQAGAKLSTHLGNGSHAQLARHPNYIWEQLAADELWASLIVDGHHLPPAVVKCFVRCKTPARGILVTDAIAAAGKPPGRYRLGEVEVEVTPARRVCLPGTPYLAGSVLELHEAIGNTVRFSDATLAEALQMASLHPAQLLGEDARCGTLAVGRQADLVLLRWNEAQAELQVQATLVRGEVVYQKTE